MRGVFLVGISGAGKTRVFNGLRNQLLMSDFSDCCCLTHVHTERVSEHLPPADREIVSKAIIESLLLQYEASESRFLASPMPRHRSASSFQQVVLAETLHLNQMAICQFDDVKWARAVEKRLYSLGVFGVYLRIAEEQIEQRSVIETCQFRGPNWRNYLSGKAPDTNAQTQYFLRMQRRMDFHVDRAECTIMTIDITDRDWNSAVKASWAKLIE